MGALFERPTLIVGLLVGVKMKPNNSRRGRFDDLDYECKERIVYMQAFECSDSAFFWPLVLRRKRKVVFLRLFIGAMSFMRLARSATMALLQHTCVCVSLATLLPVMLVHLRKQSPIDVLRKQATGLAARLQNLQ